MLAVLVAHIQNFVAIPQVMAINAVRHSQRCLADVQQESFA